MIPDAILQASWSFREFGGIKDYSANIITKPRISIANWDCLFPKKTASPWESGVPRKNVFQPSLEYEMLIVNT